MRYPTHAPRVAWFLALGLAALAGTADAQGVRTGTDLLRKDTAPTTRSGPGFFGDFTANGLAVSKVEPGSPADKAGLVPGDLILKMDNKIVRNQKEFAKVIEGSGGTVLLSVRRAATGQVERLTMTLAGGRGFPAPYYLGVLGRFGPQGMFVGMVGPGTPAGKIGIAPGDRILRINGQAMTTQNAFFQATYNSGGRVELLVVKGDTGETGLFTTKIRVFELGVMGDFTNLGVKLALVAPDTPAAKAGLRQRDLLLTVDGQFVRNQDEFMTVINNSGGTVNLAVRAANGAGKLQINVMNNPLGCWCEAVDEGMRLTTTVKGMYADRAGLGRGDVIVRVEDQRVRTLDDLLDALELVRGSARLEVRRADSGRLERIDVNVSR
jgi:S1-C subfamily serine protease